MPWIMRDKDGNICMVAACCQMQEGSTEIPLPGQEERQADDPDVIAFLRSLEKPIRQPRDLAKELDALQAQVAALSVKG